MKKPDLQRIISEAEDAALADCAVADNPLAVWARFVDLLDVAGRRRIGDDLERGGRNRWTGSAIQQGGGNDE